MDHFPRHVPAAPPAALRARAGAAALAPGGAAGAAAATLPSQAAEGGEDSRRHPASNPKGCRVEICTLIHGKWWFNQQKP